MKVRLQSTVIMISMSFYFSGCSQNPPGLGKPKYTLTSLKDFRCDSSDIRPGTEISILGFSGGKSNEKGDMNYSQFIVKNKISGDTIRILAAYITVDTATGPSNYVFTPALAYDSKKGMREATFEVPNNDELAMLRLEAATSDDGNADVDKMNAAFAHNDTAIKKEYVITYKDVPLFAAHYKTAIGVLHFKQNPW